MGEVSGIPVFSPAVGTSLAARSHYPLITPVMRKSRQSLSARYEKAGKRNLVAFMSCDMVLR
jgi:hypothetical protein